MIVLGSFFLSVTAFIVACAACYAVGGFDVFRKKIPGGSLYVGHIEKMLKDMSENKK